MTTLTATPGYDAVPQLETTTLALGGPAAPMNSQAQALLNRTAQLKADADAHAAAVDPHPQYTTDAEVDAKIAAAASTSLLYFLIQI